MSHPRTRSSARSRMLAVCLAGATTLLAGCSGILDVENPNQVLRDDLSNPVAANAVANGALSTVARSISSTILPMSVVGDELKWVGSYDSGRELEQGHLSNARNEFTMSAFPSLSQGRWMSDEAIRLLTIMDEEGTLPDRNDLARSYLYAGIAYTTIGDHFEDFVISDANQPQPPIGQENMGTVYDRAIEDFSNGLDIVASTGNKELKAALLANRARARHAQAVRQKVHSPGASPLVDNAEMVADANAFLALSMEPDWKFRFAHSNLTISNTLGSWINERREFRFGDDYIVPDASGKLVGSIKMKDPIDDIVDPALSGIIDEFIVARQYGPLTITSSREMHLILAEAALAGGDDHTAASHLNDVRAMDGLTPYSGQMPAVTLLRHMRVVNLFMQGRRTLDMYRFGERSPLWLPTSEAYTSMSAQLPIADIEARSNCYIVGTC